VKMVDLLELRKTTMLNRLATSMSRRCSEKGRITCDGCSVLTKCLDWWDTTVVNAPNSRNSYLNLIGEFHTKILNGVYTRRKGG
jgi:hypothetical protein